MHDVAHAVCGYDDKWLSNWPCVDQDKDQVDVLRDVRVTERHGVRICTSFKVFWSEGWNGYWETLMAPVRIAANTEGHCCRPSEGRVMSLFDNSGQYLHSFDTPL